MSPAIPAATLILVREGSAPQPELLMVQRSAQMAFAPLAAVFPGGRVDGDDHSLGASLGPSGPEIVAAIRETIEETGISAGLAPLPSPEQARAMQDALLAGEQFAALLDRMSLSIVPGGLHRFARWLPDQALPRRFDTTFFIAASPPGNWPPRVDGAENSVAEWVSAADVLRRERDGQARLIFPTRCNLQRLAQHRSFAAMVEDVVRHPVGTITPWIERDGDKQVLRIPAGIGYPVTHAPLESTRRL